MPNKGNKSDNKSHATKRKTYESTDDVESKKSKSESRSTSKQDLLLTTNCNKNRENHQDGGTHHRILLKNNNAIPIEEGESSKERTKSSSQKSGCSTRSRSKSKSKEPNDHDEHDHDNCQTVKRYLDGVRPERNDVAVSLHTSEDEFEESDNGSLAGDQNGDNERALSDYDSGSDNNSLEKEDGEVDDEVTFSRQSQQQPTLEQKIQKLKKDPQYQEILDSLAKDSIKQQRSKDRKKSSGRRHTHDHDDGADIGEVQNEHLLNNSHNDNDVMRHLADKAVERRLVKSPSDTTLYTPAC